MALERFTEHRPSQQSKVYKLVTANHSMAPYEFNINCVISGSITVTLPLASEAAGRIYTIVANSTAVNTVTITHKGDTTNWTNITLNDTTKNAVLYSNGADWFSLK